VSVGHGPTCAFPVFFQLLAGKATHQPQTTMAARHRASTTSSPERSSRNESGQTRSQPVAQPSSGPFERPHQLKGAWRIPATEASARDSRDRSHLARELERVLDAARGGKQNESSKPGQRHAISVRKAPPEASSAAARRDGILGLGFRFHNHGCGMI